MNVSPSLKATDLDALIKELSSPRVTGHKTADVSLISGKSIRVPLGLAYDMPGWQPNPGYDGSMGIAGRLSGYDVVLDRCCITPRMSLSRRFVEIQSPKLVRETQEWMNSFFGFDYPIHLYRGKLVMHPEALRQLMLTLDKRNQLGHSR